jgi:hypothetical protein
MSKTCIFSHYGISLFLATLKEFGCELLLELEGNRAGTVAVQAMHARTRSEQDVDVAGWLLRVAVNRSGFNKRTHVCFEAKQDLFLKCIRATLRTDLAIIQRRL